MKRGLLWKGMVIYIGILSILSAQHKCYQIDKQYIKTNLEPEAGVIVDIGSLFSNPTKDEYNITSGYVDILFDTPRYIPYAGNASLECSKEENETIFHCEGDCDGGHASIMNKKDGIYFKIGGARLSQTTDDPIIYWIEGRSEDYIKGKPVSCFPSLDAIVKVHNYEKDPNKAHLITSLSKLKDIIIRDIDYNDEVAIAVGEDNSVETRKSYSKDEYHKALILYSFDKGKSWQRTYREETPFTDVKLIKEKKAIACGSMEGSGGTIAMTDDGGKTWKTVYSGDFVNGVTVHRDTFFAAGFSIMKSHDGMAWETIYKSDTELSAIESVDGKRLIAVGDGLILFSDDNGMSWHKAKLSNDASAQRARKIFQKEGKLYVVAGGPDFWFLVSSDHGNSWHAEGPEKE